MAKKIKKKLSALNIGAYASTIIAHVAIIVLVILANGYFNLSIKVAVSVLILIVCLLAIIDILLIYGVNFKDISSKIISIVLAVMLIVVGFGGSYYVSKVNKAVDNATENTGVEQYETLSGVFTYYKGGTEYTSLDDLKDASNLKVGVIYDDGAGVGTIAQNLLTENGIEAAVTTYYSAEELLGALLGNTDKIDVAVFPASYRQRWSADEEVDYSQYLDNMVDFYSFEEKVKTGENTNANKALYTEPFNILLIGFAPEDEAMTRGLADTIIVATVNPQTFTVTLTSVARDTYTKIACVPEAERQKINAARNYSRQCLMDTVGDLLDIDIDYYMEVNFLGVVEIVDAIGGIVVNNPVEFVGQTASGIRGEYTVLVPAGENVVCDGEMALAFARERHAMPNGDFDRQQHQQEVIARIAEKLLAMDVNQALKVMEAAGNNFTTNLSLNQLTGIFNYIVNHTNTTGMSAFNMIDIRNMRLTGYASWYYSYIMMLPQWIYKLYEGSIAEAQDEIKDTMNDYTTSDIKQECYMKFFVEYPYSRGQLYSDYFNEQEVHEEMPAYYPLLKGKTYETAMSLAAEQGITLEVTWISPSDPGYDASSDGYVVSQYPAQGALVSSYPTGSITVMGSNDPNYVPEYTVEGCNDEASCIAFANNKGIKYSIETKTDTDGTHTEGSFAGASVSNGDKIKKTDTLIIYRWTAKKAVETVTIPSYDGQAADVYRSALEQLGFSVTVLTTSENATSNNNGSIQSVSPSVGSSVSKGSTVTIYVYSYTETTHTHTWNDGEVTEQANCDKEGKKTYTCTSCGETKTEPIPKLENCNVESTTQAGSKEEE